jgi:hypothetical protein
MLQYMISYIGYYPQMKNGSDTESKAEGKTMWVGPSNETLYNVRYVPLFAC